MIPITIPTFTNIWIANIEAMPAATYVPNGSFDRHAMRIARQSSSANSASSAHRSDEPELLPHHGEDEVGVLLGHVVQVRLRAVQVSLAEEAAGPDRDLRLVEVVPDVGGGVAIDRGTPSAGRAGSP